MADFTAQAYDTTPVPPLVPSGTIDSSIIDLMTSQEAWHHVAILCRAQLGPDCPPTPEYSGLGNDEALSSLDPPTFPSPLPIDHSPFLPYHNVAPAQISSAAIASSSSLSFQVTTTPTSSPPALPYRLSTPLPKTPQSTPAPSASIQYTPPFVALSPLSDHSYLQPSSPHTPIRTLTRTALPVDASTIFMPDTPQKPGPAPRQLANTHLASPQPRSHYRAHTSGRHATPYARPSSPKSSSFARPSSSRRQSPIPTHIPKAIQFMPQAGTSASYYPTNYTQREHRVGQAVPRQPPLHLITSSSLPRNRAVSRTASQEAIEGLRNIMAAGNYNAVDMWTVYKSILKPRDPDSTFHPVTEEEWSRKKQNSGR
ncbi:hypothetical protein CYLTODRAFT_485688 [Cylindrobasidium torrendii FP15055 ss-10]|uniref:Uncharacterized protein n=1 Tax=Cylindrobasidium torrendii FP15055 ss-10 TaxID=1314674 RepID=A0A0D7BS86_9AGAR|nr:hypothetical protein CYLTODRAFT_485688 [Cylindrobasidium torrendii FP15055 ss-10]